MVTGQQKTAYISNLVTAATFIGLNSPGANFFADMDGDNLTTGLDIILAENCINFAICNFPNVLPHNGDTGAVGLGTSPSPSGLNDIVLNQPYPSYPDTDFVVELYDESGNSLADNDLVFANKGRIVAEVRLKLNDHTGTWPRSGLGINFTWNYAMTLLNAFAKEIPSGTTFDPLIDDTNGNGFQDCCYAYQAGGSRVTDCNAPVDAGFNCALGVTWQMFSGSETFGWAVGTDPNQPPLIQNAVASDGEHVAQLEAFMPANTALLVPNDITKTINLRIKVPKPEITQVGTKSVSSGFTETFNGVRQPIKGDFLQYNGQPAVGDNRSALLEISSWDCSCWTVATADVNGESFTTPAPLDFQAACGIPVSLFDCSFDMTATGYDSLGFPSLTSDAITIRVNPRDTSIPPVILLPEDSGIYTESTWLGDIYGEGRAFAAIDVYDTNICDPVCSGTPPAPDCGSSGLIGSSMCNPDGTWDTTTTLSDGAFNIKAVAHDGAGYCEVSNSPSFIKDTQAPRVNVSAPDPWQLNVLMSWSDPDLIPESTDAHAAMPRLHRTFPTSSDYELWGDIFDELLATSEVKLVNQIPADPAQPDVLETFRFSPSCFDGQFLNGCQLPGDLLTEAGQPVTSEEFLRDKFFHLVLEGQDPYHPPTHVELPLIITRDPLVEITVNRIDPSFPADYIGMNGSDAVPLEPCSGIKKDKLAIPNYSTFNIEVPESGFDIDLWLSDPFLTFIDAGLLSVKGAPGDGNAFPDASLDFYVDAAGMPVTVKEYDGFATAERQIPPGADWASPAYYMPFEDWIMDHPTKVSKRMGIIRYNGARANYPIVDINDVINFPVAHFPEPLPGEVNTVTAWGTVLLEASDGSVYPYDLSPYDFDIGNWALPDAGTTSTDSPNETWDDYKPFDHTQIIFMCMDADRAAAYDLIGRDIDGDTDPEDIFDTNPYFDVCNPDTYCEYPDMNQPDPIAGYKCATSEWGMSTPEYAMDGTYHKALRIMGINSATAELYLVPESAYTTKEVTMNRRVRHMVGERDRASDYPPYKIEFDENTQTEVVDYDSLNIRLAFTYEQLINLLDEAGLPSDPINRRNFYSVWFYQGLVWVPTGPGIAAYATMGINIDNRDLAFSMPKKSNICEIGGSMINIAKTNGLFNQFIISAYGSRHKMNHCSKIIESIDPVTGDPIYPPGCSEQEVPGEQYKNCANTNDVPVDKRYCYQCDMYMNGWMWPYNTFRPYDCFGQPATDPDPSDNLPAPIPLGEWPVITEEMEILSPDYIPPNCNDYANLSGVEKRGCDFIFAVDWGGRAGGPHEWGHKFGLTATGPPPCGSFGCTSIDYDHVIAPFPGPPEPDPNCQMNAGDKARWLTIHTRSPRGGAYYFGYTMGGKSGQPKHGRESGYSPVNWAYLQHRLIFDDHTCPGLYYQFWNFSGNDHRGRQWPGAHNLKRYDTGERLPGLVPGDENCILNPVSIP